jgi:hypothetical protein
MSTAAESKVAIIVFAGIDTHEGLARVVNALMTAKEARERGGDAEIIFDGAGVTAAVELADPDHRSHRVYSQVEDCVTGVCKFCARSFGVDERARELKLSFVDEYKQHPSLYGRIADGATVLTF